MQPFLLHHQQLRVLLFFVHPCRVERGAVGAALQSVRPLCMELVHSPRAQCVQAITTEMRLFDKEVVQELQQFLIFPLRTVLAQCAGSKLL